MSVLMTLEVPGGTTAQYDRTIAAMGIAEDGGLPPGLIVHTCAVTTTSSRSSTSGTP